MRRSFAAHRIMLYANKQTPGIGHVRTCTALVFALLLLGSCVAFGMYPKPGHVNAACANSTYGSATQSVNVLAAGSYRIWARIQGPNPTTNGFNLEVDGGTCYSVGGANLSANTWTWVDYQNGNTSSKMNITLSQKTYTLRYVGTKPGLLVDKVILIPDAACIPTGDGSICSNMTSTSPAVPAPIINSFGASPASVTAGNRTTLNWTTANTTICSINPSGAQNTTLKSWTTPTLTSIGTQTYTLTCQNSAGQSTSRTTSVTVSAAASAPGKPTFVSSSTNVPSGGSATLSWSSINATSCTVTPGNVTSKGTASLVVSNIRSTVTYNLSCSNSVGTTKADPITISVSSGSNPIQTSAPTIMSFTADPTSITSGNAATLTWLVNGASVSGCRLVPSPLSATSGNGSWRTPTLTESTAYTLTCINESGKSVSRSLSISVDGKPAPVAPTGVAPSMSDTDTKLKLTASNGAMVTNGGNSSMVSGLTTLDPSNITDPSKEKAISRVEYFQDDKLVQTVDKAPFALDTTKLRNGQYTITERTYFQDGSQSDITKVVQVANSLPNTGGSGGSGGRAGLVLSIILLMAAAGVVGFFVLRRKLSAVSDNAYTEQPYDFFADPKMYPQAMQQNQEFKDPYETPSADSGDWKR